jgi:hypothetical protein
VSDYKNIEAELVEKQIQDAASIYLFEGWYYLSDLQRMVDEAREGKRVVKGNSND